MEDVEGAVEGGGVGGVGVVREVVVGGVGFGRVGDRRKKVGGGWGGVAEEHEDVPDAELGGEGNGVVEEGEVPAGSVGGRGDVEVGLRRGGCQFSCSGRGLLGYQLVGNVPALQQLLLSPANPSQIPQVLALGLRNRIDKAVRDLVVAIGAPALRRSFLHRSSRGGLLLRRPCLERSLCQESRWRGNGGL